MSIFDDIIKALPENSILREKARNLETNNTLLKDEIAALKDDKRELEAENIRLKEQIQSLTHKDDLDELAIKILTYLAESHGKWIENSDLEALLQLPLIRVKYHMEKLVDQGYVASRYYGEPLSTYSLTSKGREYAVENNLI